MFSPNPHPYSGLSHRRAACHAIQPTDRRPGLRSKLVILCQSPSRVPMLTFFNFWPGSKCAGAKLSFVFWQCRDSTQSRTENLHRSKEGVRCSSDLAPSWTPHVIYFDFGPGSPMWHAHCFIFAGLGRDSGSWTIVWKQLGS